MEPRGLEGTTEERDGGRDQPVNSRVFYHIRACVTTDRDVTVTRVTTCRSDFNKLSVLRHCRQRRQPGSIQLRDQQNKHPQT
jgi:hypothetical protein